MIFKPALLYQKLSKREKWILYVVFIVLGLLLTDQLIIGPLFQKLTILNRQILEEETLIKKSLHVLLRKQQIAAESRRLVIFSANSENPEQEMTLLLKELENIANRSSVSLLYVKPGNMKESRGVKKYFATLEFEAQMAEITGFFHNIENSTKLLRIEKYSIQPKNKEAGIAKCALIVSNMILS